MCILDHGSQAAVNPTQTSYLSSSHLQITLLLWQFCCSLFLCILNKKYLELHNYLELHQSTGFSIYTIKLLETHPNDNVFNITPHNKLCLNYMMKHLLCNKHSRRHFLFTLLCYLYIKEMSYNFAKKISAKNKYFINSV